MRATISLASPGARSRELCAHYLQSSSQRPDEVAVITNPIFTGSQRLLAHPGSGTAQEKWFTEFRGHKEWFE